MAKCSRCTHTARKMPFLSKILLAPLIALIDMIDAALKIDGGFLIYAELRGMTMACGGKPVSSPSNWHNHWNNQSCLFPQFQGKEPREVTICLPGKLE